VISHLYILFFILFSACSIFKGQDSSQQNIPARSISSISDSIEIVEQDNIIIINGNVKIGGEQDKNRTFAFPLIKLSSTYYSDNKYDLIIDTDQVDCFNSDDITKNSKNNFTISSYKYGAYVNCEYTGIRQSQINYSYILPRYKSFNLSKADWRVGYDEKIITPAIILLSKINDKLKKNKPLYYRDREILLKYFGKIETIKFDPSVHRHQFKTVLEKNDIVELTNISGEISHSIYGVMDVMGGSNKRYRKKSRAGLKYLEPKDVPPYAFFCKNDKKVKYFQYTDSTRIDKPGNIACSINTRRPSIWWRVKLGGSITAIINQLKINEVRKELPRMLKAPQDHIDKLVGRINHTNKSQLVDLLVRSITEYESNTFDMQEVNKLFPMTIEVSSRLISSELHHEAVSEISYDQGVKWKLAYNIYQRSKMKDFSQEYIISDFYLGKLITNHELAEDSDLSVYTNTFNVDGWYFENELAPFYTEATRNNLPVNYQEYMERFKGDSGNLVNVSGKVEEVKLKRFMMEACGTVRPYLSEGKSLNKVVLTEIRARYDAQYGGINTTYRRINPENFFHMNKKLKTHKTIFTKVKYTGDEENCFYLSPEDFISSWYNDSDFHKSNK